MKIKPFILCHMAFWHLNVFAQIIYMMPDSATQIAVDSQYGATISLPSNVHVATNPKYFTAQPLASGPESKDVSVFHISIPKNTHVLADKMNILLWSGTSVSLNLVADKNLADTMYSIKLQNSKEHSKHSGSGYESALLKEKTLLLHMIKDESVFDRRVVNMNLTFPEYHDLQFRLVRLYHQDDYSGYVFIVKNQGTKTLTLNATALSMGKPNRIKLIQIDHERLQTCEKNSDTDPRGSGCTTALRLIAQGNNSTDYTKVENISLPDPASKAPFILKTTSPKNEKG